ncbi:glycosyltransferase [Nitrospirillum iridis]|uniref:GT2 family glycosyltransferase/glycosyltransferase involved in cell wall biosynthesis n=1 Tax=Nitrospirillum iridis TaxID=765888 RepID=A0A7X0EFF2_9PROT|nr:glycosyltransferase [Nitrospirillum iridis]MBB6252991.1 GT2 family glycosyltransferase/glycosyltransferase involved in cell wall biosynthesis [Nitrospirillum iridis]
MKQKKSQVDAGARKRGGFPNVSERLRALRDAGPHPAPESRVQSADYALLSSSDLFSRDWYLLTYPDVATVGMDPIHHYLEYGWREGRQPGPDFDAQQYLDANPDVAAAGLPALVHYLRHGEAEGRRFYAPKIQYNSRKFWFHIGDSVEWLKERPQITGVGRVSTELLFAILENSIGREVRPCVFGDSPTGIVAASMADDIQYLSKRMGRKLSGQRPAASSASARAFPVPGDHILFTGLVWTPTYTEKFKYFSSVGIDFSVLVHDIIPIEHPEMVGPDYHKAFTEWMTTVLMTASVIYVSNEHVKQKIRRFAMLRKIRTEPTIVDISFGLRAPESNAATAATVVEMPDRQDFVLCVGTIDERKNQRFLCQLWVKLASQLGEGALPRLVLAGRDDLGVVQSDSAVRALAARGKIQVLENLTDAQISDLYRRCLFTAFPSLSEGYGLPVAESLLYGKVCLTSNLPEIRAHAGDFVWYFAPGDMKGALEVFTKAIGDRTALRKAEARIAEGFDPPQWRDTILDMLEAASAADRNRARSADGRNEVCFAGAREIDPVATLIKATRYCTDQKPDVSILIINWNAAELTLECLRQIWSQTDGHTYEIIIVDNGSALDDVAKLRDLGPGVRLLDLGMNRYFGEANNIAAEVATGRYLCLLNNDAFAQPDWLTALVAPLRTDPRVGATGPMFLYPDGVIQEAGGVIDPNGYPIRFGRGERQASDEVLKPKFVDYISAAALVIPRDVFMEVGGFDLAYEPAYYEDTDLCMKIQAMGRNVLYCPDARIIHIEGSSANGNAEAEARRKALGDLNRDKFTARWGQYLKTRREARLLAVRKQFLPSAPPLPPMTVPAAGKARPKAVVCTPYELTPGGGERYLLTLAMALSEDYDVAVVSPWRYSRLRLRNLGCEFNLDLSRLDIMAEAEFLQADPPDLMVSMGNHIIPPIAARGKHNIYHCQFPFPMGRSAIGLADREIFSGYQQIVVNSHYTSTHILANLSAYQLPNIPIKVINPPVPLIDCGTPVKKRIILSVGRFFAGGHSKRHDALIDTYKKIMPMFGEPVELHLAGSSMPGSIHMDYLAKVRAAAEGYPVHLHVNISAEDLHKLYCEAPVYWHGTGIGADLIENPAKAEHFGIAIVEAMSARAVPFALNSGGPREIIADGETGFLYDTPESLAEKTLSIFSKSNASHLTQIGLAAGRRAQAFSQQAFIDNVKALIRSSASA